MPRKLLAAEDELVAKLTAISNQQGKTFYAFVNDLFAAVLRIYDKGKTLQEVAEYYEFMGAQRTSGTVLTPLDALDYLSGKLTEEEKKKLGDLWYSAGVWYGKYLTSRFPSDTLGAFGTLLALSRSELAEVQVTSGESVRVRCAAPLLSLEYTRFLRKYVEGAVHSLGYETTRDEYMKGLILLEFRKKI